MNDTLQWALVALGFLVILVQGRSAAILLVALQAILLGVGALLLAPGRPTAFLIAGLVLLARSIPSSSCSASACAAPGSESPLSRR